MKNLNDLACEAYEINVEKGYYKEPINIPEKLCLIHSEVTEALEADRKDKRIFLTQSQKNVLSGWVNDEDFKANFKELVKGTFEEEMADIIIRTISLCAYLGIDIDYFVQAKIRYNKGGEIKKY